MQPNILAIVNSSNVQVGEGNVQHSFTQGLQTLLACVDALPGSPEERAEATGLLRKFMEHPLVRNVSQGLVEIVSSQAKTDLELVDLIWEKRAFRSPDDWKRRLDVLSESITALEARLDYAPPAELFIIASQLMERYRQLLESAREAYTSSPRYLDIKKGIVAGIERLSKLSGNAQ